MFSNACIWLINPQGAFGEFSNTRFNNLLSLFTSGIRHMWLTFRKNDSGSFFDNYSTKLNIPGILVSL